MQKGRCSLTGDPHAAQRLARRSLEQFTQHTGSFTGTAVHAAVRAASPDFNMEETMKICPNPDCGNKNPDTNKFCNYCGAQLSGVEPVEGPVKEPDFSRFFAPEQVTAAGPAGQDRSARYEDFTTGRGGQKSPQPGGQKSPQPGGQSTYRPGGQNTYRQGKGNVPGQGTRKIVRTDHTQQYTYSPTPFDSKIPEIAIGKYIAWSIFDILFSLIFGILGLIFVLKINRSDTVEEQQKNLKYARIFLIIGTVIAVLNIFLTLLPRFF